METKRITLKERLDYISNVLFEYETYHLSNEIIDRDNADMIIKYVDSLSKTLKEIEADIAEE